MGVVLMLVMMMCTLGLVFSAKDRFFSNSTRPLHSSGPKLMRFLSSPSTAPLSIRAGGHMVAFAGRQFAATSLPVFAADGTHTVTSFTLVLEFQKGTLQNLYFKKFGCASCAGNFVCLNNTDCAVPHSKCKSKGGPVDCTLSIQVAFSGTDKSDAVLNSWYEVANLRQYSLYALFSDHQPLH